MIRDLADRAGVSQPVMSLLLALALVQVGLALFALAAPLVSGILTALVLVAGTSQYFQRQPLR